MEQEKTAGSAAASPQGEKKRDSTGNGLGKRGGRVAEEIGKASEIYKEIYGDEEDDRDNREGTL